MLDRLKIVHEGRGGYIEIGGHRYVIEHVEGGRFCIHFPSGNRTRAREVHLIALQALCNAEPDSWALERRHRSAARGLSRR